MKSIEQTLRKTVPTCYTTSAISSRTLPLRCISSQANSTHIPVSCSSSPSSSAWSHEQDKVRGIRAFTSSSSSSSSSSSTSASATSSASVSSSASSGASVSSSSSANASSSSNSSSTSNIAQTQQEVPGTEIPNKDGGFPPPSILEGVKSKSSQSKKTTATGSTKSAEGRAAYLDFQSTTPMDPRVLDAMLPWFTENYGNPHSRTHVYGWTAEGAVEKARSQIANLINATSPREIIFTSGATESNNIAVKGVGRFYGNRKRHVITTQTEHKCVLDSCRQLEKEGFDVTYLPVQGNGLVDIKELENAIREDTSLVSIMGVNNEIGVIQPLKEIGELCRSKKVFFHSDCAQMLGKMNIDVEDMKIDLMSMSGHKLYGPKGIGALYVRRRPRVRVEPQMSGGGQERGLRSGTVPTPLAVGLGEACELSGKEMENDNKWISYLSDRLYKGITSRLDHVYLNGDPVHRYPGNLNLSFAYVEGESMLMALKSIAVSSGSACTSASLEPSYVLRSLGVDEELAHTSLRFGIGRFTTEDEIDHAIETCAEAVNRLREMSPLYEMVQEGIDLKSINWTQEH